MAIKVEKTSLTTNGSNGSTAAMALQDPVHLPRRLPFWFTMREYLKRGWEPVTVNKSIDSVTMPKWIATAILGAVLMFGSASWWRASDQRDMLIELRTEIRLSKEFDAEKTKQMKEQTELNKVYIDNMTSQLNIIKGMLSVQQLSTVEKKGDN